VCLTYELLSKSPEPRRKGGKVQNDVTGKREGVEAKLFALIQETWDESMFKCAADVRAGKEPTGDSKYDSNEAHSLNYHKTSRVVI